MKSGSEEVDQNERNLGEFVLLYFVPNFLLIEVTKDKYSCKWKDFY